MKPQSRAVTMSHPRPTPVPRVQPRFLRIAERLPLPLLRRAVARDVLALFYHTVAGAALPHVAPLYACKSASEFERDLRYLKEHFTPVSHEDLVAARERGRPLPANAVSITFDDGFAECHATARPLLLKHGVPCTFFVIETAIGNRAMMHRNKVALCLARLEAAAAGEAGALLDAVANSCRRRFASLASLRAWAAGLRFRDRDAIDALCEALGVDIAAYLRERRPYLDESQLDSLLRDGFTLGAHTLEHPELAELPWMEASHQIAESCKRMRERTGRVRVPFAFPFNGLALPRGPLAALRDELGSIDLMYDTNNLMRDRAFIVNRIWCDFPARSLEDTNLPALLARAHALEPLRAARRRFTLH